MDDVLAQTLTPDEAALWQQYLSAEAQGQRSRTLIALRKFVEALQADSEERRQHFAETYCRQVVNEGRTLPLREPLFAAIIGPYLVSVHQQGNDNAANWIAYFHLNFLNMPSSQMLLDLPRMSPINLLSDAFRRNPDNAQTQELLIQKLEEQFDYAVHEVPSGVLYGIKGATVIECQEWEMDLALFCEVVQKRNETEKYQEAIRYWSFHFHGYADYLTHRDQYESYADYIDRHWQPKDEAD